MTPIDPFTLRTWQRIEDERDRLLVQNTDRQTEIDKLRNEYHALDVSARAEIDQLRTEAATLQLRLDGSKTIVHQQRKMIEGLNRKLAYRRDRSGTVLSAAFLEGTPADR